MNKIIVLCSSAPKLRYTQSRAELQSTTTNSKRYRSEWATSAHSAGKRDSLFFTEAGQVRYTKRKAGRAMNYVLVTYKKKIEELPEIKVFENADFYKAKRDFLHYQSINVKVEMWESDGETARKLNI